ERRPASRRVDLVLEVEGRALLTMRTAVDIDDQGILAVGAEVGRIGEEGFDGPLVVVADERKLLYRLDRLALNDVAVDAGEFFRSFVTGFKVKLGEGVRRGKRVGDLIAVDGPAVDAAAFDDDRDRLAAADGHPVQMHATAFLNREENRASVGGPVRFP